MWFKSRKKSNMHNSLNELPLIKDLEWAVYVTYPENHLIKCVFMAPKHAIRINIKTKFTRNSSDLIYGGKHSQKECMFQLRGVVIISTYCTFNAPYYTALCCYPNVRLSVCVSYFIWMYFFGEACIYQAERNAKSSDLTLSTEVNKNKSEVFAEKMSLM